MKSTFYFYDLETSGLSARHQRVMQFAGQRTDMDLKPIGEPVDVLIKLSADILPEPQAILITGTTPQKTIQDGISEPEFCKVLIETIFTPGTIAVGFNNVRFDDEFIRHTLWRNFYDPYEWSWLDGRSRWDMLDVVRMTRALRPDGITWPVDADGKATNRLELIAKANNLNHTHAHDALSDVEATIEVAKLIHKKQPKLFEYLLKMRDKKELAKTINLDDPKPFVYSSGRYGSQHTFTTIGFPIAPGPRAGTILVYDLRYNPRNFSSLSIKDIKARLFASWQERKAETFEPIPVKELTLNKCPAVAPLGVMDKAAWERVALNKQDIEKNLTDLSGDFVDKVTAAYREREPYKKEDDVEGQLYEGFMNDKDKLRLSVIRAADEKALSDFHPDFVDERLPELLLRYKARNYPRSLTEDEQAQWDRQVSKKFEVSAPNFMLALQKLAAEKASDENAQFILEELRLWCEQIAPIES